MKLSVLQLRRIIKEEVELSRVRHIIRHLIKEDVSENVTINEVTYDTSDTGLSPNEVDFYINATIAGHQFQIWKRLSAPLDKQDGEYILRSSGNDSLSNAIATNLVEHFVEYGIDASKELTNYAFADDDDLNDFTEDEKKVRQTWLAVKDLHEKIKNDSSLKQQMINKVLNAMKSDPQMSEDELRNLSDDLLRHEEDYGNSW